MASAKLDRKLAEKLENHIRDVQIEQDTALRKHISNAANNWHRSSSATAADLVSARIANLFQEIMNKNSDLSDPEIRKAKAELRRQSMVSLHAHVKEHLKRLAANTYCDFLEEGCPLYWEGNPNYGEKEDSEYDLETKARELLEQHLQQYGAKT